MADVQVCNPSSSVASYSHFSWVQEWYVLLPLDIIVFASRGYCYCSNMPIYYYTTCILDRTCSGLGTYVGVVLFAKHYNSSFWFLPFETYTFAIFHAYIHVALSFTAHEFIIRLHWFVSDSLMSWFTGQLTATVYLYMSHCCHYKRLLCSLVWFSHSCCNIISFFASIDCWYMYLIYAFRIFGCKHLLYNSVSTCIRYYYAWMANIF